MLDNITALLPWKILHSFINLMVIYDNWIGLFSALHPSYFHQFSTATVEQKIPSTFALYKLEKVIPEFLEEAERFVRFSFVTVPLHYFPSITESAHLKVFIAFLYHTVLEASQDIDPSFSAKYIRLLKQLDIPQGISNPAFIMSDYHFFDKILQLM